MMVYFRGGLFPWGFISVGFYSLGVIFRGGLFPRPTQTNYGLVPTHLKALKKIGSELNLN